MEFENELDKLRAMLDEAQIPYESYKREWSPEATVNTPELFAGNERFVHNQVLYGKISLVEWKIEALCEYGSYGAKYGLIETSGLLGTDAEGDPLVLHADDVFQIIKEDWEKTNA